MSTTARAHAKEEVDIPAFVDDVREVNRKAVRIVNASWGDLRQALTNALDELEETVKVLRAASSQPQTSAAGKSAAKHVGTQTALVLDTTEAMVNERQLVTPIEFQRLMGWTTRQAVWKAAESHRVFYLSYKSERYFPAFYSDPAYDRKQLEAVTKVLGDLPGGSKLQFFLTRKGSLGGATPLQALAAGHVAKVKNLAAAFAEVSMEA